MQFNFSRYGLTAAQERVQRFFEIVPGFTSWAIIVGMTVLAVVRPAIAAVIIIAFDFHWLLRLFYITIFLVLSYNRLTIEKETDWMARVKGLDDIDSLIEGLNKPVPGEDAKARLSGFFFRKQAQSIKAKNMVMPKSGDIYHLVIVPVAKETEDIVEPDIKSIAENTFPADRILVVIALEERAADTVKQGIRNIQRRYKDRFLGLEVAVHADGVEGEARVKGANVTNAAKEARKHIEARGIPFENVIVSCFDSDTVVSPGYFACLTYNFMVCQERLRASFQPIPVYYNNIWEVPGFARVLETGSSFFQLVESTNSEKLVTFSSHSMSFKALVDVGYWPVDMVSDDSAIYWKAFMKFDGDYRVVPMYTTVSMDIVAADSWWKTIVNEYKQKRRWAWGVENFPIVMRGFLGSRKISFYTKIRLGFKLFEGHIAWATWAFILTIIGWLPVIFASRAIRHEVIYYSIPRITGTIFNLATLSLVISIILSLCLLPRDDKMRNPLLKRIGFAVQWIFIPFIAFFLSAIPALDAQTRLMLGKRMEFWVAEKKREHKV
ncbi:MAG: glycosyltransferase family 2 protein [Candidatus Omnitrophota bacterium]